MLQDFDDSSIVGYLREMREHFRKALLTPNDGGCITIYSREEFLFHYEMLEKVMASLKEGTQ